MFRAPITKALSTLGSPTRVVTNLAIRTSASAASTPAKAPEKIEVFVDDIPVMVAPGTTVLQVKLINYFAWCIAHELRMHLLLLFFVLFRQQQWLVLKFQDFVIMKD